MHNPNRGLFVLLFSLFTAGLTVILICIMWAVSASAEDTLKLVAAAILSIFLLIAAGIMAYDGWKAFVRLQNYRPRIDPWISD